MTKETLDFVAPLSAEKLQNFFGVFLQFQIGVDTPDNKWLTMMRGAAGMTGLTQELVDAMIEKVLVYGEGRIKVVLNYNDVFYAMLECVEQIKEAGGDD